MPLYEYGCSACGGRSTALLASWSGPDPPCRHCGSTHVHRLISTFATSRSESGASELSEGSDYGDGHGYGQEDGLEGSSEADFDDQ